VSAGVFVRYAVQGAWHVAHSWAEPQDADLPLSLDLPEVRISSERSSIVALCGFAAPWSQMTEQANTATLKAFIDSVKGLRGILSHSACDHCLLLEASFREATPEEVRAAVALRREALTESLRVLPF
jgi:hypothetical protein